MLNPHSEQFKKEVRQGLTKVMEYYNGGNNEEYTSEMLGVMTLFVVEVVSEHELKQMSK